MTMTTENSTIHPASVTNPIPLSRMDKTSACNHESATSRLNSVSPGNLRMLKSFRSRFTLVYPSATATRRISHNSGFRKKTAAACKTSNNQFSDTFYHTPIQSCFSSIVTKIGMEWIVATDCYLRVGQIDHLPDNL